MRKKYVAVALLTLAASMSGTAAASNYPCRSPEWNLWIESLVNTRDQYSNLEIGSPIWQQAVESRLPASSWPSRNSVLWCATVEQKIASIKK
ncbi:MULTISPECIES: hypothetical protein [Dickeya]|uniref:Uncharacterized protein n=1 Tax=Dickeya aquatica TaxID=1401087 RepID=A0A375AES0_9GAMM|nr:MULTISPECIES: hypothetical protein [Dickeya]SLM64406.1 FIG00614068: hypothetical protein [Dickeya aquatica]